jgi:hypothetical protein
MNNITDESVMDVEKRKYYVQSYEFTMLGFLIDEDEFEVSPAVSRVLQVIEFEKTTTKRAKKKDLENTVISNEILFVIGNTTISQLYSYTANLVLGETKNIQSFDVYINNEYYGSDVNEIQVNTNDVVKIMVSKLDDTQEGIIYFQDKLL